MGSQVVRFGMLILVGLVASQANAQTLTTLASLGISSGYFPQWGGLTLSGSTLYGATQTTVFSIPTSGGSPSTLLVFGGSVNAEAFGSLTLSGSTLYGTTDYGGANRCGMVFSIPTSGGSGTILTLLNNTTGDYPAAGLILNGSTLYWNN